MNERKLSHQDFLDAGYRHFFQRGAKQYTDEGFQKKVTDENGTRYFITVYIYDWKDFSHVMKVRENRYSFEPDVQFNTENPVQVQLLHPDSIEEIETKFDTLWKALGCPYYERY